MAIDWARANTRICEALELDANNVAALRITLRRGNPPEVDVAFLLTDTSTLASELERAFVLMPKDEHA